MNHYEVLEVSPNASDTVIKAAYKSLVQIFHPDKNNSPSAEQRIKDINVAYAILSDPYKREQYDFSLKNSFQKETFEEKKGTPKKKFTPTETFYLSKGLLRITKYALYYRDKFIKAADIRTITFSVEKVRHYETDEMEHKVSIIADKTVDISIYTQPIFSQIKRDEVFNEILINLVNTYADSILRNVIKQIEELGEYAFFNSKFTRHGFFLNTIKTKFEPYLIHYNQLGIRPLEDGKMQIYEKDKEDMNLIFSLKNTPNGLIIKYLCELLDGYQFKEPEETSPTITPVKVSSPKTPYVPYVEPKNSLSWRLIFSGITLFILVFILFKNFV